MHGVESRGAGREPPDLNAIGGHGEGQVVAVLPAAGVVRW